MSVQFVVDGIAAPQGSKTPWGTEANPKTRPWRAAVSAAAALAMGDTPKLTGPLMLDIVFEFPRPKNHYGTGRNAGVVKASAPYHHASKPDTDKLARAVGDALTGIVFADDSQVSRLVAVKLYGEHAKASIYVRALA